MGYEDRMSVDVVFDHLRRIARNYPEDHGIDEVVSQIFPLMMTLDNLITRADKNRLEQFVEVSERNRLITRL